jgi:hypothetical protein
MREFASVTCPGCGAKVDVPLGVTMVIIDAGMVRATATGSAQHQCDGRQQVQG